MADYPSNWGEIAASVKEAAFRRCENCGHPDSFPGRVLTVHHLDGDKSNCEDWNLVAMCQRCHLSVQAKYRVGQLALPGIERPAWMTKRGLGRERSRAGRRESNSGA